MTTLPDLEPPPRGSKFIACAVPNCHRNSHYSAKGSQGWCRAHYLRMCRYGDPLGGSKTLEGDPAHFFRETVLRYDGDECLTWPYGKNGDGYGQMRFQGKMRRVSRLVCEHVNGPPPTPKHEAAHSCGNGHLSCVTKRHLSWKTPAENKADQIRHGTWAHGASHARAKLTESDVRTIRALRGKVSLKDLSSQFGIAESMIGEIQKDRRWTSLDADTSKRSSAQ